MRLPCLSQQFVYNPIECQMNTAFALAYSIDALGSKHGITPNRIYIEDRWLSSIMSIKPGLIEYGDQCLKLLWKKPIAITIHYDAILEVDVRGRRLTVYKVSRFIVHAEFEGEETEFPMAEHDQWAQAEPRPQAKSTGKGREKASEPLCTQASCHPHATALSRTVS